MRVFGGCAPPHIRRIVQYKRTTRIKVTRQSVQTRGQDKPQLELEEDEDSEPEELEPSASTGTSSRSNAPPFNEISLRLWQAMQKATGDLSGDHRSWRFAKQAVAAGSNAVPHAHLEQNTPSPEVRCTVFVLSFRTWTTCSGSLNLATACCCPAPLKSEVSPSSVNSSTPAPAAAAPSFSTGTCLCAGILPPRGNNGGCGTQPSSTGLHPERIFRATQCL